MAAPKKQVPRGTRQRQSEDEVVAAIHKRFGREILISGAELAGRKIERVTTGSLNFDLMYGGGFPLNQWNEIIGNPSSGKTSMIFATIAANQDIDPEYYVLWVASEHFVAPWAEAAGCDVSRFKIVETNVMEEAYETIIEYLDNRLCDAVVIDSFPQLVPSQEDDESMIAFQVGLGARLTNKFFRKVSPAQKRSLTDTEDRACLLLVVNQWRYKIGVLFGDPRTTPGGQGKDYAYFTRTEVARDEWLKAGDAEADDKTKKRVGIRIRAHTIKNKTAPNERMATVDLYFDDVPDQIPGRYDIGRDLVSGGLYTEVIEKKGNSYEFAGQTWRSVAAVQQAFREDLDLRRLLRYEALRSIGAEVEPPEPQKTPRVATQRRAPAKPTQARTGAPTKPTKPVSKR